MEIKTITLDDYPKLIEFWKAHYVVVELLITMCEIGLISDLSLETISLAPAMRTSSPVPQVSDDCICS